MGQNHLDLVRGKEPPRTSMLTITKGQTALVHANKLVVGCLFHRFFLFGLCTKLIEPQRVELVCIWKDGGVGVNCNGRYLDYETSWNNLTVG